MFLLDKTHKRSIEKHPNTAMFYGKLNNSQSKLNRRNKKFSKGNSIEVFLEKQYLPGDQFIPSDQFIPGDQFIFLNTKFKILKKTKNLLKIVAL